MGDPFYTVVAFVLGFASVPFRHPGRAGSVRPLSKHTRETDETIEWRRSDAVDGRAQLRHVAERLQHGDVFGLEF